jgi:hypothetical protein
MDAGKVIPLAGPSSKEEGPCHRETPIAGAAANSSINYVLISVGARLAAGKLLALTACLPT